jgi:hypothetical protein
MMATPPPERRLAENAPLDRNPDGSRRSAADIEADIARTREMMGSTLDALEQKLAPRELLQQGINMFRDGFSGEQGRIGETLRNNPIPIALIGVGIGWLLLSNTRASERAGRIAANTARRVRESARGAADTVQDTAGAALEQVKHTAAAAADRVRSAVGNKASVEADPAYARAKTSVGADPYTAPLTGTGAPYDGGHESDIRRHAAIDAATEAGRAARSRAESYARYAGDTARSFGDRLGDLVDQYPIAAGGLAMLAGAVLAVSLPSTRSEDELIGDTRDSLRDELAEEGRDTLERVQRVAERAAIAGADAAKSAAREEAEKQHLTPAAAEEAVTAATSRKEGGNADLSAGAKP